MINMLRNVTSFTKACPELRSVYCFTVELSQIRSNILKSRGDLFAPMSTCLWKPWSPLKWIPSSVLSLLPLVQTSWFSLLWPMTTHWKCPKHPTLQFHIEGRGLELPSLCNGPTESLEEYKEVSKRIIRSMCSKKAHVDMVRESHCGQRENSNKAWTKCVILMSPRQGHHHMSCRAQRGH